MEDLVEFLPLMAEEDLGAAIDAYCVILHGTAHQHEGLRAFSEFRKRIWRRLNVATAAQLATIFAAEPGFESDYGDLCAKIKRLIASSN